MQKAILEQKKIPEIHKNTNLLFRRKTRVDDETIPLADGHHFMV